LQACQGTRAGVQCQVSSTLQPTSAGSCPKDTPPTKGEETASDYTPGGRGKKEAWAGYGSQFGDFGTGILRTGARSKEEELSRFWRKSPLSC